MEKSKCDNCKLNPVKHPVAYTAFHILKEERINLCEKCCSKLCLMGTIREVKKL